METSETPIFPSFEAELASCQQVFPASRPALPGSDEARKMTVGSGRQLSMLLNQSSPLGAFSKILLESSAFTNSEEFCYVWQVWDTRLDCSAFRLTPLAQSIEENGCSLWRSPTGTEDNGGGSNGHDRLVQGHTLRLRDQVKTPTLWPSPSAGNFNELSEVASLLPTPRHDHSGLESHGVTAIGGSLNPRFVEELMGFPIDHTALKPSATPSCPSKSTRSSQRSPKSVH